MSLPTRADKMDFVTELLNAIKLDIGRKIATDAVPVDWDGFELRQLIADKVSMQTVKMSASRAKSYRNTVLINNL